MEAVGEVDCIDSTISAGGGVVQILAERGDGEDSAAAGDELIVMERGAGMEDGDSVDCLGLVEVEMAPPLRGVPG